MQYPNQTICVHFGYESVSEQIWYRFQTDFIKEDPKISNENWFWTVFKHWE